MKSSADEKSRNFFPEKYQILAEARIQEEKP